MVFEIHTYAWAWQLYCNSSTDKPWALSATSLKRKELNMKYEWTVQPAQEDAEVGTINKMSINLRKKIHTHTQILEELNKSYKDIKALSYAEPEGRSYFSLITVPGSNEGISLR